MRAQSYKGLGKSDLQPVLAPLSLLCDCSLDARQPGLHLQLVAVPCSHDGDLRSFLSISSKKCPLGKLDSLNDCCKNCCKIGVCCLMTARTYHRNSSRNRGRRMRITCKATALNKIAQRTNSPLKFLRLIFGQSLCYCIKRLLYTLY